MLRIPENAMSQSNLLHPSRSPDSISIHERGWYADLQNLQILEGFPIELAG